VLLILGFLGYQGYTESSRNARVLWDIQLLATTLRTQGTQKWNLPVPTANRSYYTANGSYAHTQAGAYGVSSTLSDDLLTGMSADFPTDPRTGGYYGYGKTFGASETYQIAGILSNKWTYTAHVVGLTGSGTLPGLIQGYNSTDFVVDKGSVTLPYNPFAKELIGQVIFSSGSLTRTPAKPMTARFITGESLTVPAGGEALIKLSDGSQLVVGHPSQSSTLSFSGLTYKDDTGLLTQVKLLLTGGQAWVAAPTLRSRDGNTSEFEIETNGSVAAIRGTIFRIGGDTPGRADIDLIEGSLALRKRNSSIPLSIVGGSEPGILTVKRGEAPKSIGITEASYQITPETFIGEERSVPLRLLERISTSSGVNQ
jgi:hypothetical protein